MVQGLTAQDINDLRKEGYSDNEISEALKEIEIEEQHKGMMNQQRQYTQQMSSMNSAFAPQNQDNLIKWQLELDNILERAEHILRGDKLEFDSYRNLIWNRNTNPDDNILNEYGVSEVMRILSMYLNRNTILSDYEPEEINIKVLDFGRELNDLFFMKYEEMGLDVSFERAFQILYRTDNKIMFSDEGIKVIIRQDNNMLLFQSLSPVQMDEITIHRNRLALEKRKNYPMLLRELVDIIHSAYKRALRGGEKRSLREARTITQSENIQGQGGVTINTGQNQGAQRGILNPLRYFVSPRKS
jgi:hypothetical protein